MLQERAASEALAGKEEVAKVLRCIEKAEASKVCYKLVRKYLKPSSRGGITCIEVQNEDGTTRIVTEPSEVFNLILKRNHAHFSQATGTPSRTPPLSDWLGKCGETEMGQDILNGSDKADLGSACPFPEIQVILDALQLFDPPAILVPITVTDADYRNVFASGQSRPRHRLQASILTITKHCSILALNKNHQSSLWLTQSLNSNSNSNSNSAMLH